MDRLGAVPDVRLSGYWLEQAGLAPGARLSVEVEYGRLVITVIAPAGAVEAAPFANGKLLSRYLRTGRHCYAPRDGEP